MTLDELMDRNRELGRGYDALGQPRPLTAQEFFDVSCEMGCNQDDADYRRLFEHLARWIQRTLKPRSTLEIGCGPGYLLDCLNQLGIDAIGVDGNGVSRAFFLGRHPMFADRYLIDPVFEGTYRPVDAVIAIECFEHIPDEGLHALMTRLRDELKPKFVVFSSTPHPSPFPEWDLQWGHINLKPPEDWDALFSRFGFIRSNVKPPVTEWATLYVAEPVVGGGAGEVR